MRARLLSLQRLVASVCTSGTLASPSLHHVLPSRSASPEATRLPLFTCTLLAPAVTPTISRTGPRGSCRPAAPCPLPSPATRFHEPALLTCVPRPQPPFPAPLRHLVWMSPSPRPLTWGVPSKIVTRRQRGHHSRPWAAGGRVPSALWPDGHQTLAEDSVWDHVPMSPRGQGCPSRSRAASDCPSPESPPRGKETPRDCVHLLQ